MDKFAVVLEDEHNKVASMKGTPCPQCGSSNVNYRGLTPLCPQCGSQPWEPKEKQNGASQSRR